MPDDTPSDPRQAAAERPIGRGVKKALLGPVNLSVAAASALASAALASWPLLALGAVAYSALVAWDLSSQTFWKRVLNPAQKLERLPVPRELADPETRALVERVHAARAEIARTVAAAPASVTAPLHEPLAALEEVDQRVGRLALRSEQLSRYLGTRDARALRDEAAHLRERASGARDADTRRSYQEAAAAREDQVSTIDEIAGARERIMADLLRITATLEGIPGRLVKMEALDAAAVDRLSDDVGRELGQMNTELGAYEETLASLAGTSE
jgi:hypothetical protein